MISGMARRTSPGYACSDCGQTTAVWNGRCSGCGGWNTLEAQRESSGSGVVARSVPLSELHALGARPVAVGIDDVDRVLGGGLVPGSVTLLSGPPGVGKSTLALQIAAGVARGASVLYGSAEETVTQVRLRTDRLVDVIPAGLSVTDDTSVDALCGAIRADRPALVIVDSIQAIADPDVASIPGSATQVRGCAQRLAAAARATGSSLMLIGHVTKDGSIAGPRLLEHLVDTVVTFDADLDHGLRFLRAIKHRFGSVGELGVFTMHADGLHGVGDVAGLFLEGRRRGVAGSVVTPASEGRRTLLVEVQALVDAAPTGSVRVCQGVPRGRVELLRAVIERHAGVVGDAYVSVAGGFAVTEPAVDLAVAMALVSAASGTVVDPATVICGEVGLAGEVRGIAEVERRLADAARLGFDRAIVPHTTPDEVVIPGMALRRVADVREAAEALTREVTMSIVG